MTPKIKERREGNLASAAFVIDDFTSELRYHRGWSKVAQAWKQELAQKCLKQAVSLRVFSKLHMCCARASDVSSALICKTV